MLRERLAYILETRLFLRRFPLTFSNFVEQVVPCSPVKSPRSQAFVLLNGFALSAVVVWAQKCVKLAMLDRGDVLGAI